MTVDIALFLVCRACRKPFAAEHGLSDRHCSEACAVPPVNMPDDDDCYDGLPFDPESTVRHCVIPGANADLSVLPSEWAARAKRYPYGCCCGHDHQVLSRDEVRTYRLAGFEVCLNDESGHDLYDGGDSWEDDYYDNHADYWPTRTYSKQEWLEGLRFSENEVDRSVWSREFEVLQDMLSDELEVVRDMGFGLPSGAVEITDGEPAPRPLPPLARPLAKSDVVTVGVFRVRATKPGENPHGYTYVIEHAHGGLVPYPHGGYTKSLGFFRRQDAIEEAHLVWAITSEPRPATLRFRKGFYPLMKA